MCVSDRQFELAQTAEIKEIWKLPFFGRLCEWVRKCFAAYEALRIRTVHVTHVIYPPKQRK